MYQLKKMPFIKFLLDISKLSFPTYDRFYSDGHNFGCSLCINIFRRIERDVLCMPGLTCNDPDVVFSREVQ